MRYHRFIGAFNLEHDLINVTDLHLISQWHSVLRLKTGDKVILSDGNGTESEAIIEDMNKKSTTLAVLTRKKIIRGTQKEVTLYASLLRRENFEIVVQKATEIGISRIVPLLTERTVKIGFNKARLEKIILEACEQSGRTTVPELSEPISFEQAIKSIDPKHTILFDGSGKNLNEKDSISNLNTINLFVGPEGGFGDKEVLSAKDSGCTIASLGELTLRAETAAIVVCYLGCK
ncbi:MAG: RsmE family RNA methyltransferase [bacterium]